MARSLRLILIAPTLMAAFLLGACGGDNSPPSVAISTPGAPVVNSDPATDALTWFNFRRQQIGLSVVTRSATIDVASQGHSDYQKDNNTITHTEIAGKPGFIGVDLRARLLAAGITIPDPNSIGFAGYAFGEVISSANNNVGENAAEDLIGAIYHRYVIFEPMYKQAGAGVATIKNGATYITVDFLAIGLDSGLATGAFVHYPFTDQTQVPTDVLTDNEEPDPVPNQNQAGYPISVHSNTDNTLIVTSFTVKPRGGANLSVQLLTSDLDVHTPSSAAAIIPLAPLTAATTYDVHFVGTVASVAADQTWSFTTK